jgi:PAS domain S-box-containing protein
MAGKATPKVFCGGPQPLGDAAAVMRMKLPADRLAHINIINLFQPGNGDTICFPTTGFSATTAVINGREHNLAEYLQRIQADTRLPLVANYCGAMVNVSLRSVDPQNGRVEFYAPVVSGTEYKLASPVKDYVSEFEARLKELSPDNVLFSCNCVLNYLYSKLEGHRTGDLVGPITFGEIAFQLLNQTLVFVEIVKVAAAEPREAAADLKAAQMELSAAHEELQASERRFRALSESAPMGIFLADAAGRLLYENPRCHKLSGISTEDAIAGVAWIRTIHPNDLPGVIAANEESEREGRDFDQEFRFVCPDGKTHWVHMRTACLRSETGEITGRIGTVEDISERKQAEIELERVSQDLIRASREAGMAELASGVLHNVKNAMNSINVSAGVIASLLKQSESASLEKVTALLREHAGDLGSFITEHPKGKLVPQYLEQLAQQLAREHEAVLEELRQFEEKVQHIKDVVTTQQNCAKLGGTSEKVKPVDLMEDSLRIVSASLARHGIKLIREYDANLPDITVEKHKALQILVNFMRNAKEACQSSDRPDRKVALRATNGGEFVHLAVTDNGVGILPENLGRLFDHGFTTKKDGHGFGLHSSSRVVLELGGDIQVHSDGPGTGATFSLKLPLCCPAAK